MKEMKLFLHINKKLLKDSNEELGNSEEDEFSDLTT